MLYEGRCVLVTGAAHGIGLAIARAFHQEGAHVALSDMDETALWTAARELGDRASAHAADVRSKGAVEGVVQEVLERHGGIDVLVSNAGIYPSHPFLDMTEEQWDRVLDVNAKGSFLVGQAVARAMVEKGSGVIVNIASGSAASPVRVPLTIAPRRPLW